MATAGFFGVQNALIVGNTGGAIQQLPPVSLYGARKRSISDRIALAAQPIGSIIMIGRIPVLSVLTELRFVTDTSLGSATISVGDVNNATAYSAAFTLTTTQAPAWAANAGSHGVPILSGWDCVSGLASTSYEDVVITTAVAALPGSGNLTWYLEYSID